MAWQVNVIGMDSRKLLAVMAFATEWAALGYCDAMNIEPALEARVTGQCSTGARPATGPIVWAARPGRSVIQRRPDLWEE